VETFSKAFLRLGAGKWLCKEMVTLQAADGRQIQVTPGVTYTRGKQVDGIDVAQWLDEYHERNKPPSGGWRSVPGAASES